MQLESGRIYMDELQVALDAVARCLDAVRDGEFVLSKRGVAPQRRDKDEAEEEDDEDGGGGGGYGSAGGGAAGAKDDENSVAERPASQGRPVSRGHHDDGMTQQEAQAIYSNRR